MSAERADVEDWVDVLRLPHLAEEE